jgi:hypothetical protein
LSPILYIVKVLHVALTGSPLQAADVAKLSSAPARHMLTGFRVLDQGAAAVASSPAFLFGHLVRQDHGLIHWAVILSM